MNITDAIDEFINYCIFEKGLSDKTKASYYNDLSIYKNFLLENSITTINKITSSDIKAFLKERNRKSPTTVAHNLTVIKNFHSYAKN